MRTIPVLLYHHVSPYQNDVYSVTPDQFENQMKFLRERGYQTLNLDELMSYLSGHMSLKTKAVVVTFDDGWLDNYIYAFPVIKKYQISTAMFLVTDWIRSASLSIGSDETPFMYCHKPSKELIEKGVFKGVVLNWALIKEMACSGLVNFYSHTASHHVCTTISKNDLDRELGESRRLLDTSLDRPCSYLAWPWGRHDSVLTGVAKQIGYSGAFTTVPGIVTDSSDPFEIRRIVVNGNFDLFRAIIFLSTTPSLARMVFGLNDIKRSIRQQIHFRMRNCQSR